MSLCFNYARRALTTTSSSTPLRHIISAPTSSILPITTTQQRPFSAAAAKPKKKKDESPTISHSERKAAAKQIRTQRYQAHQERLERLKTRRDNSPKDVKKSLFQGWLYQQLKYHSVLEKQAKKEGKPWRIRVAAMVERLPVVTPDMPEWEEEYYMLRAYLDTYGREMPGFMPDDKEEDHVVETDEEMLAGLPFTPAPRETEHDHSGNVKTLDRRLKTRVYLTVKTDKEGNRNGPRWTLPSVIPTNEETLLQAARRAVADAAGEELTIWCPGNAPMAVNYRAYSKNMPEEFTQNYIGEKIFYYRVQYDSGDVDENVCLKNGMEDYAWLTREEIVETITQERDEHQAKFFHYML